METVMMDFARFASPDFAVNSARANTRGMTPGKHWHNAWHVREWKRFTSSNRFANHQAPQDWTSTFTGRPPKLKEGMK